MLQAEIPMQLPVTVRTEDIALGNFGLEALEPPAKGTSAGREKIRFPWVAVVKVERDRIVLAALQAGKGLLVGPEPGQDCFLSGVTLRLHLRAAASVPGPLVTPLLGEVPNARHSFLLKTSRGGRTRTADFLRPRQAR